MHIAHVQGIYSAEHGGPYHSLRNYCEGQAASGLSVSVRVLTGFAGTSSAQALPAAIDFAADRVCFPAALGRSPTMRRRLRTDSTPDVYHLHGAWLLAMQYGAKEALRRRVPYVVEVMGMYEPYSLSVKWIRKFIARRIFQDRILRGADCLHVNSDQEANNLRALGFKNPIAVIPVGVAVPDQPPASSIAPWAELNGNRYVLFLSRIHSKKGIECLIQAWPTVVQRYPDVRLVIAGSGAPEYVARCKAMASELGLGSSCLWVGHISERDKVSAFACASAFVLPSASENFGNAVAEALAYECPVVTTSGTPWHELDQKGCGRITKPEPLGIATALTELLSADENTRARMGRCGKQWVIESFSLQSVLLKMDTMYRWLAKGGPKPPHVKE